MKIVELPGDKERRQTVEEIGQTLREEVQGGHCFVIYELGPGGDVNHLHTDIEYVRLIGWLEGVKHQMLEEWQV